MTIARSRQISLADTPYEGQAKSWEAKSEDTHPIPALTTHSPHTFLKLSDLRRLFF